MTKTTAAQVKKALRAQATPERARVSQRFFKTGSDQYGAGDEFIGVRVPDMRRLVREFREISLNEILSLLKSRTHEDRLMALFLLVDRYRRAKKDPDEQGRIAAAYLEHLEWVNSWDLVDSSAPQILGSFLLSQKRSLVYELARSESLWKRRVAMLSTQAWIKEGQSADALALAEMFLSDEEDLMHKASGWMLREVGEKVGLADLRGFLKKHHRAMPRTMLRYSIEKLPQAERQRWMDR